MRGLRHIHRKVCKGAEFDGPQEMQRHNRPRQKYGRAIGKRVNINHFEIVPYAADD
jgi:hypothetical protein